MSTIAAPLRTNSHRLLSHKRAWLLTSIGLILFAGAVAYQVDAVSMTGLRGSDDIGFLRRGQADHSSPTATSDAQAFSTQQSAELIALFRPAPGEHPIEPIIRWAESRIGELRAVEDYDCTFTKREIVDDELQNRETIYMRVRHEPFSVYLNFLAPSSYRGKEVLFVENQNQGRLKAHLTGIKRFVGSRSLSPTSSLAMRGNRYPITEIGILNLTERMIEAGKAERALPNCVVNLGTSKVGNQPCVQIEVLHPVREPQQRFQRALIYIDEQYNLPIRYVAYGWQTDTAASPEPYEEYTYTDLHFNCGLNDRHFHAGNPEYKFR